MKKKNKTKKSLLEMQSFKDRFISRLNRKKTKNSKILAIMISDDFCIAKGVHFYSRAINLKHFNKYFEISHFENNTTINRQFINQNTKINQLKIK